MSPLWGTRIRRPTARIAELVVEELGDELLVYDQQTDDVHCLGSAAAQVWRACDGETSVEQLGAALNMDGDLLSRALGELESCGLLEGDAGKGLTRREATSRLAKIGAGAAVAPLIYSIAAPSPALATTPCGTGHLGCQGFFVTSTNSVCPSPKCLANGCACCLTSVKCTHAGAVGQGAWAACIGAVACPAAECPTNSVQGLVDQCGSIVNTDCAGHLNKSHCCDTTGKCS